MTKDSWDAEALKRRLNAYSPFVGARIEVTYFADDAREVQVRMPLEKSNTNFVGTHFGGSLYAMVDPHLMILLIRRLGPDYVVATVLKKLYVRRRREAVSGSRKG